MGCEVLLRLGSQAVHTAQVQRPPRGQIPVASWIAGPQGKGQPSARLAMNGLQAKPSIPIHLAPRTSVVSFGCSGSLGSWDNTSFISFLSKSDLALSWGSSPLARIF